MKKRIRTTAFLVLLSLLLVSCAAVAEKPEVHVAALKGPTGMGLARLMEESEQGGTANAYTFTLAGAPDAIVSQLVTGEVDMAALPTNSIALLYQKTNGQVQSLAINTLGVLYLLEKGDSVRSLSDVSGKTVVSAGRGSTAEAVAGRLFGKDASIDYVSEHAEVVAQAAAGKYDLALLPEPFVTLMLSQDKAFRVALDLTAEWEASGAGLLPMGGIAVRREFAEKNPKAVEAFLEEYEQSVSYVNENPKEAAALIEKHDILKAAVAESAIPRANMVLLVGGEMRAALEAFYAVLLSDNPALLGGALPGDDFYYAP